MLIIMVVYHKHQVHNLNTCGGVSTNIDKNDEVYIGWYSVYKNQCNNELT